MIAEFIKRPASIPCVAHPQYGMEIADAAGTLLYVWFLEAHRGAKFCVPRSSLAQNGGDPGSTRLRRSFSSACNRNRKCCLNPPAGGY